MLLFVFLCFVYAELLVDSHVIDCFCAFICNVFGVLWLVVSIVVAFRVIVLACLLRIMLLCCCCCSCFDIVLSCSILLLFLMIRCLLLSCDSLQVVVLFVFGIVCF